MSQRLRVLANPGGKEKINPSLCLVQGPWVQSCSPPPRDAAILMEPWASTESPHIPAQGQGPGVCGSPPEHPSAGSAAASPPTPGWSPAGGWPGLPKPGMGLFAGGSSRRVQTQPRRALKLLPRPCGITRD